MTENDVISYYGFACEVLLIDVLEFHMIEVRSRKPNRIMTSFLVIGHDSGEAENVSVFLAHALNS